MSDDGDQPRWIETAVSVLGAVGFNKVRMRWKLRGWVNERRAARNRRENAGRHLTYENRVCPSCHATNARDEETCTRCGAKLQARPVEIAARLGLHLPKGTTYLVALAMVIVFVRTAIASSATAPLDIDPYVLIGHRGVEWWRHATSALLHTGLFHLALGLVSLLVVGPFVEEHYGRWMVAPLFVLFGVAASIGSGAIGASGAVMGMVGCVAMVGQRMGIRRGKTIRNEMLLWAVFMTFFGFVVDADPFAHLWGFVAGAAFGLVVRPGWLARSVAIALGIAGLLALAVTTWAAVGPA